MVKQIKGFTGFPKVHVEENETEIQTATREIKEETNVDMQLDKNKRYVIYYSPKPNTYK